MNRAPVVYLRAARPDDSGWAERDVANRHLRVVESVEGVRTGELVVGRFSLQPFYQAIEQTVLERGASLINSYGQHRFAADLSQWVDVLGEDTFATWGSLDDVPHDRPLIVKGETNGRKHDWAGTFFAPNKKQAQAIVARLADDQLLTQQKLFFRAFTPLREFIPTDGKRPPVVEEYRFFVLDNQIVAAGFYWAQFADQLRRGGIIPDPAAVPAVFIERIIGKLAGRIRFAAVDVARTAEDKWVVVEVNDGCASGLTSINPEDFYSNLAHLLSRSSPLER